MEKVNIQGVMGTDESQSTSFFLWSKSSVFLLTAKPGFYNKIVITLRLGKQQTHVIELLQPQQ